MHAPCLNTAETAPPCPNWPTPRPLICRPSSTRCVSSP
ncbi:EspF repeat-containing protein [Rhodoferax sp.]